MTNSEHRRLTHWRLRLLRAAQDAGNVAWTCRHFGISRKTFYKWRRRYHEHGDVGLADRARAPHHSPVMFQFSADATITPPAGRN
jgi:transposase-like protein